MGLSFLWESYKQIRETVVGDATAEPGRMDGVTTLTPEAADELRDLRRRAYGPEAGASLRDADVQRLHDLERQAKVGDEPVAGEPGDDVPESAALAEDRAQPSSVALPSDGLETDSAVEPLPARPRSPWWRHRSIWIAAAAGLVIGCASTWGIGMLRAVPPTEVLQPTDKKAPDFSSLRTPESLDLDLDTMQHYGPWGALDIWTAERADGADCLLFSSEQQDDGSGYFADLRCAVPGLDPQYDLWVWDGMGRYLGVDLPVESNVRFVARGGVVDVWVQPAGEPSVE